jgi:cytochrome o ubiquinol oxidase subunit 2
VQIPVDRPVTFELTADDAPMSAFWIPNVGGQLYAMTGHVNQLNLLADTPGTYRGSSPEINGAGFADMTFAANVSTEAGFNTWVRDMQQNTSSLDSNAYDKLLKPSEATPAAYFGHYDSDLYAKVLMKYMSHDMHTHEGGE